MTMTKFSRINKQREEITMRVLEDMEKGGNEWKKPWVEASPLPPHNPVSGTQYSGRNFLYTYVYGMMRGYADPRWVTEKQIKEMGWKIPENLQNGRGGINDELGVGIEHWGMYAYIPRVKKDGTPLTDKGGTQKFTRVRAVKENGVWGRYRKGDNGKYEFEQLPSGVHPHPECDRYFKVFNLSLIEGVPPLPVPDLAPNDDIEVGLLADDVIASSRCEVFEGSTDGAYYNFVNDKISVPSREAFNSNSSFLASLLHEMGHSTAPALDRQMTGDMRSKEYAHEEIVAELSSIFSSVDLAVKAETDPEAAGYGEHVAYLEFWKGRLDSVTGTDEYEATKEELCDDFFAAASQASQATDFIIDRYEQEVGHPAAGKEIVQKLDMPEKTEQEDRADRSLSHKKETARDASAHMQGDRADLVNMRDENAIYIDSKVNGLGDVPHFTLYDVSVADIEECMAWGTKHLDEVPGQIHVVNGSPHIATIYVTGPDDRRINDLLFTLCEDGRWSYVSELDAETLARFNEIIAKADRIEAGIVKDDEWRDGMVEQVSGFMDKIKDMDAEEAEGADTVLAETFNSIDALSTDAAIDLLRVYSNCDASGRDAVAKTFYALSGESFDSYLMTASEVCKKTLGMLEPEPPQPAKTKNLSQKTMSSREASNRLSDEIGVKPCTRDEGTVGDS